jgi:hypothetical protein
MSTYERRINTCQRQVSTCQRQIRACEQGIRRAPFLALLAGSLALVPSCVSAPAASDWMAVGYRTPLQTVRTFQTAVRAEEPDLELRCFSSAFRARNHISRLTWREFFEELQKQQPFLRKGIADAEVEGDIDQRGGRARVRLASHGVELRVDLVLEDFGQVWTGDSLLVDEDLKFSDPEHTGLQEGAAGGRWFYGRLALPAEAPTSKITELRLAREWKIDGIESLGEASGQSSSARSPPR